MRPITDILREIRKGRVVEDASDALADVVRAVNDTNKAGSLTITLKVKPNGDGAVELQATVKPTLPRGELPSGLFFATADGDLVREDPSQREMFADVADASERRAVA